MNFYVAILILKMEENTQRFQYIMLSFFKKGKNATETQKKICAVYGEGAVIDRTYQDGLWSFKLEISRWTILHGHVTSSSLQRSNQDINWEQSMLYHMGDIRHTQNIQINEVIGENEK